MATSSPKLSPHTAYDGASDHQPYHPDTSNGNGDYPPDPSPAQQFNSGHHSAHNLSPRGEETNGTADLADFLREGAGNGHENALGNGNGTNEPKLPGPPYSSYSTAAVPATANYGTEPCGEIGVHYPREIVRIERDWAGGEVCQFDSSFPMELEGRVTPTQFQRLINEINEHLELAYSQRAAIWENVLAVITWQLSILVLPSRFEKEIKEVERIIERANVELWNEQGLNVLSPRKVGLQFLEIEYY